MYGDTPTGAPLYKLYGASQDEMKKFGLMYSLLSRLRQYTEYSSAEMGFWTYRSDRGAPIPYFVFSSHHQLTWKSGTRKGVPFLVAVAAT